MCVCRGVRCECVCVYESIHVCRGAIVVVRLWDILACNVQAQTTSTSDLRAAAWKCGSSF